MNAPLPPAVDCHQLHPGLAVTNIPEAVDFYATRLGFKKGFTWGDPPTFAGMKLGEVEIFFAKGTPTPEARPTALYFRVADADELYAFHRATGVKVEQPIEDRAWGLRDYAVRDLNGYVLVFGHPIHNQGPPLPIERASVPLRLEKRLAALLKDLAAHKRMSVDSCLEEILLHTSDGVEPHTKSTLRYIQELKKKHGIDYDTHASHRFVEK